MKNVFHSILRLRFSFKDRTMPKTRIEERKMKPVLLNVALDKLCAVQGQ